MNKRSLSTVRLSVLALLALSVLLITGCSGQPGPSPDKVRLDMQDRVDLKYRGMLKLTNFVITQREMPSEDRVRLHCETTFAIDKPRVQKLLDRERNQIGSNVTFKAKMAKRVDGQVFHAVTLYKRQSQDIWKLAYVKADQ